MKKLFVKIEVDSKELDETMEKVNQLIEKLKEANQIIRDLQPKK